MLDSDLHVLPGPPHAGLKRRVLDELMRNPFLDDDLQMFSARLGTPRRELSEVLAGLSMAGFVRSTGRNSYMLDMEIGSAGGESAVATESLLWDPPTDSEQPFGQPPNSNAATTDVGEIETEALKNAAPETLVFLPDMTAPATQKLVEALPIGVVVFSDEGVLKLSNQRASDWLGLPVDVLDGATFEIMTGVNPMEVLTGEPIIFSAQEPVPVEISIRPCLIESGVAVLVVVRDTTLQEEVSKIQAHLQEEIFDQMRDEMVDPLFTIEQFLERPDGSMLVQARAAMEQINWFMRQFFLRDEPK